MIAGAVLLVAGAGPFALGRSKQPSAPPPFVATRVRRVTLESSVVPPSVVQRAAAEVLRGVDEVGDASIAALAARIDAWYRENGYVFCRVANHRGVTRDGELRLVATEPPAAAVPVHLQYYSPTAAAAPAAPAANASGAGGGADGRGAAMALRSALLWPPLLGAPPVRRVDRLGRALKRARAAGAPPALLEAAEGRMQRWSKQLGLRPASRLLSALAAGEIVKVSGETRPGVAADALGLRRGRPLRLRQRAWETLCEEGPFADAEASPRLVNGSGLLVMRVVERGADRGRPAKTRQFEPSFAYSRGSMTGELSVTDDNFLGRNQQVRLDVANSVDQPLPDVRVSVRDARLGRPLALTAKLFRTSADAPTDDAPADAPDAAAAADAAAPSADGEARPIGAADDEPYAAASSFEMGGAPEAAAEPAEPEIGGRSGGELELTGRAGATSFGVGASAERVEIAGGFELPLLLSAKVSQPIFRPRDARRGKLHLSLARALPLRPECPDYWRLKSAFSISSPLPRSWLPSAPRWLRRRPRVLEVSAAPPSDVIFAAAPRGRRPPPAPPAPRPPPLERPPFDWRDRRTWRQAAGVARAWAAHHALPSLTASRLKWTVRGVAAPSGAPAYELQGIGGDGSVRGYDGGQIGRAHASATTSVELSMPFLSAPPVPRDQVIPSRPPPPSRQMPISLALFADAGGGLTKRARESSLLRHGVLQSAGAAVGGAAAGYGLRYGPIKIDVAYSVDGVKKVHVGLAADSLE